MSTQSAHWLTLGHISGVHGVRGWVKVHSYTQPPEKIIEYKPWRLTRAGISQTVEPVDAKYSGKALVVELDGVTDREQALALRQSDICIGADQLPHLSAGEYYWYQLEGLRVTSVYQGKRYPLGTVDHLLETGANDVLVVKGDQDSIDRKERLIPYLVGQTVLNIDLDAGNIQVDWDPEF